MLERQHEAKTVAEKSELAVIVDVRSQNEFAAETVENSVNLPLENLDDIVEEFAKLTCLLVCKRGARSQIALEKLRKHGVENVCNLGLISRIEKLRAAPA